MTKHYSSFPSKEERTIGKVSFTKRELDTISCIFNLKGTKKIAQILDLSPKTVDGYIASIFHKIGINAQEGIRNFIVTEGKAEQVNEHYYDLLKEYNLTFELKKIAKIDPRKISTFVAFSDNSDLSEKLKKYLTWAGIQIIDKELHEKFITIRILDEFNTQDINLDPKKTIFIRASEKTVTLKGSITLDYIDSNEIANLVFNILKILLPHIDIKPFQERYVSSIIETSLSKSLVFHSKSENDISLAVSKKISKTKKYILGFIIILSVVSALCSFAKVYFSFYQKIHTHLPIPNKQIYLERNGYFEILKEFFSSKDSIQTSVILGTAGSGKTTVARHYANNSNYNFIWEINSESSNSARMSLMELAYFLAETTEDISKLNYYRSIDIDTVWKKITFFIQAKLQSKSKWLIIFDNLNSFSDIEEYFLSISKNSGSGDIIITSRNSNITNNSFVDLKNVVRITELSKDEQLKLYYDVIGGNSKNLDKKEDTQTFLESIPPFPLDTIVASYHIKSTGMQLGDYTKYLNTARKTKTIKDQGIYIGYDASPDSRRSIIYSAIKNIVSQNNNFSNMLFLIALVDSQNIPIELLRTVNNTDVESLIAKLKENGLITNDQTIGNEQSISIHRSTQFFMLQYFMNETKKENKELSFKTISNLFRSYINNIITEVDVTKNLKILYHYEVFLQNWKKYNPRNKDASTLQLGILNQYIGDFAKSKKILEEIINNSFDKNDIDSVLAYIHLGTVYRYQGKYSESLNMLEEGVKYLKKFHSNRYDDIINANVLLAVTHKKLGNYKISFDIMKSNLKESHNTNNNFDFTWANIQFAGLNRRLGNYQEAKFLLEGALDKYLNEYLYKDNHPNVIWARSLLGLVYDDLGAYKKAESIIEKNIDITRRLYNISPDIALLIWTNTELALIRAKLGDQNKSIQDLERILILAKDKYGEQHSEIGKILYYLAAVYYEANSLDLAEKYADKSANIYELHHHPLLYKTLDLKGQILEKKYQNLNSVFYSTKDKTLLRSQAIHYYTEALKIMENNPFNEELKYNIKSKLASLKNAP